MAEEETKTGTEEERREEDKTEAKGDEVASQADNPDAVKNALRAERQAAKEAKQRADELATKVKEYEDRDKSEQEKLEERAASAERKANDAELRSLRYEVAADKGIPLNQAHRLQGSSKEELQRDAEEFAKSFRSTGGGMDGGAQTPAPGKGEDMNDLLRSAAGRGRLAA